MKKFKRENANETKQSTSSNLAPKKRKFEVFAISYLHLVFARGYKSRNLVCRRKIALTELCSCFEPRFRETFLTF